MTRTDTTPAEPLTVTPLQEQVFTQVGRNVLRYQYIELIIKDILRLIKIEVAPTAISEFTQSNHIPNSKLKLKPTFGGLIDEFLEFLETEQDQLNQKDTSSESFKRAKKAFGKGALFYLRSTLFISATTEEKEQLATALRDAVLQRNQLVHHFISQVSMSDVASLTQTLSDLKQQYAQAQFLVDQIRMYAKMAYRLRLQTTFYFQMTASLIALPEEAMIVINHIFEFCGSSQTEWVSVNHACSYAKGCDPENYAVVKTVSKVKTMSELLRSTGLFEFKQQATANGHTAMIRVVQPPSNTPNAYS